MSAVPGISEALSAMAKSAPVSRAVSRRALGDLAPRGCPPRWAEAADLLLSLTGGRGLPALGEVDFGALADFDCSLRQRRWEAPDLVIARHASGARVVLAQKDGAIYLGRYERLLCKSLRAFLERLAAERWPAPAAVGFSIHWRMGDEARKLAGRLGVVENEAASEPHDGCWSDERWFIVRDRIAARRFEDVPALLTAAMKAGVEIGLHDGRGEAVLVEPFQPVPEGAQYHIQEGLAEISIRIEGDRIEQALHYGDAGTEWSEWEGGELLIQRKRPVTEMFSAIPELQEYLHARRIHRLDRVRRTGEEVARIFGPDAWPILRELEREHGGLIAEDALSTWHLGHIVPLVAPGYIGETTPARERITALKGQPVRQVGKVWALSWLCVDEQGRFYTASGPEHEIEAGGDDLESTLLRLALDWKLKRWRTDASIGGFLEASDAERLLVALRGVAERKLDTFGHTYHSGPGFELRHRKAVLGQAAYVHLIASSAKRFCEILRPIAGEERPVRVLQDNESFPTDEEIGACARAGILLSGS